MGRPRTYSDKFLLKRLREHLIDNMGSIYTMHKPIWATYVKRMKKDERFKELVEDCRAEAEHKWEKWGLSNINGKNPDFNTGLYKHFTQNKKAFRDHNAIETDERLQKLESVANGKH